MLRTTRSAPVSTGSARSESATCPGPVVTGRRWVRAAWAGVLVVGVVAVLGACRSTPKRPALPPAPRPDTPVHELAEGELAVIPLESGPPMLGPYLAQYPLGNLGRRNDLLASNEVRSLHLLQLSLALPPHRRPQRKALAYVLTGRGTVVIDGREYPAAPGAAFRVDPGIAHSMHPSDGDTLVALVYYEPPLLDADADDSVPAE